jgi:hypothetical protein
VFQARQRKNWLDKIGLWLMNGMIVVQTINYRQKPKGRKYIQS